MTAPKSPTTWKTREAGPGSAGSKGSPPYADSGAFEQSERQTNRRALLLHPTEQDENENDLALQKNFEADTATV
jgi:hypothetical protein